MNRVELEFCTVERRGDETLVTFPDGSTCPAVPHPEMPHYHVIAHRCGYGDDLARYCFEHEVAHAFIEERFHGRKSRVLSAVASGYMLPGRDAAYEEIAAQTLQRFARANERPLVGGIRWDDLKRDFLRLVGE